MVRAESGCMFGM